MKRHRVLVLAIAAAFLSLGVAFAQHTANPRGSTKLALSGQTVSIEYGRPSLKGRSIDQLLGGLKPGGFWRLGADTSTTFTTTTDLKFGDVAVPAGVYSLWAQRSGKNQWKLVFNKQHGQWGTKHDPSKDFAFAPVHETKASTSAPMLVITLHKSGNGGVIVVHWGSMDLTSHFTAA
ncbi:MAG: DUF2911 domain-containing protein [Terriglobia bacterium]